MTKIQLVTRDCPPPVHPEPDSPPLSWEPPTTKCKDLLLAFLLLPL